jgi:hypothetical protein
MDAFIIMAQCVPGHLNPPGVSEIHTFYSTLFPAYRTFLSREGSYD